MTERKRRLPEKNPSYGGKLYWELTPKERDEFNRDMEALDALLDECGVPRLEDARTATQEGDE